jgi:hypothetical protein
MTNNLNGATDAYDGNLSLTSTAGSITLANLNLRLVGWVRLDAAVDAAITNALLNFVTNSISGSGERGDWLVTTQTEFRVAADKTVTYNWRESSAEYLDMKYYRVANLNGQAGEGGILAPNMPPARGTVIVVR